MNTETKRHIDAARQVLVGVVPNPTSQIDQITNALIYKFMDDMDQAAIKAGGDPSFFVGELERYAWTRLMDQRMGNQERMNLYSEALLKFSEAKQLPELFRGIFKSAFLPYRSPEVLGLFLNEINYFDYSHSEELGNAYEYLLSIMSSQGDAGQFRTPRHIIDFIVDVVNPTKDDKVLDPACGTGGFLVSSYRHILEQHDGKDDPEKKEKPLTPDEKRKLMNNFEGYDIDPGMVRIAQVNTYLHQFKNPKIFQYDSLSSDERWNDKFDVILANPPFMSPKGGIKPHTKFGVQSNRAEVLFVDYIMSHLRPGGRAGVIVPEGVIFQSGSAYKQLRKNLVEDGLFAVVSLPGGVFNPYAGVKTSILFFDVTLAKTLNEIVFIKIENDGFDLGATRRPIGKNDLPASVNILREWTKGKKAQDAHVIYVEKTDIAKNDDYNLSADRYRVAMDHSNVKWPMVELGEVLDYEQPTKYLVESVDYKDEYLTPVLTAGKTFVLGHTNETTGIFREGLPVIIFDDFTTATKFVDFPFKVKSSAMKILHTKKELANIRYVYYVMQNIPFTPGEHKRYWISQYSKFKIPLPSLEFQEQIVAELSGYAGIIAGAKQIAQNWKPKIDIGLEWEKVKISEVCKIERGASPRPIDKFITESSDGFNWVKIGDTKNADKYITHTAERVTKEGAEKSRKVVVGDFVLSNSMSFGRPYIMKIDGYIHDGWLRLTEDAKKIGKDFLYYILSSDIVVEQFENAATGGVVRNLNSEIVRNVIIPLPPLVIQKQIVEKIEAERVLMESAKKLIEIYEQKTKETIAKLWSD
ncbi:MAG: N-6 DNA methylase [Patescibacteria group bacterium]|jgi:type I restriction enzyme M protein